MSGNFFPYPESISIIERNISGVAVIDMLDDDYVMTEIETQCLSKVIINGGDGTKKLIIPTAFSETAPRQPMFSTIFVGNDVIVRDEQTGSEITIEPLIPARLAAYFPTFGIFQVSV